MGRSRKMKVTELKSIAHPGGFRAVWRYQVYVSGLLLSIEEVTGLKSADINVCTIYKRDD